VNQTPEFYGEIWHWQNDYPGTSNAKQLFSQARIRQVGGTSEQLGLGSGRVLAQQENLVDTASFRIWTYPLTHNGNSC
jgi:hypothetical protein